MKDFSAALSACPLFAGVDPAQMPALFTCLQGRIRTYDKGQTILRQGERAEHLGAVLSGLVQIDRVDDAGNRSLVAAVAPGELFGETFAYAGVAALPVEAVAAAPTTALLLRADRIAQPCGRACAFHHRVLTNLLRILADKNVQLNEKLAVLSQRTTRDKLLTYLALQAQKTGSRRLTLPFNRQELADYLEVDRSGLSAEISKLRRAGVLQCQRNRFTLL